MSQKKKQNKDPFAGLSWDDLNAWAGSRIVSRGKSYQRQGLVSDLAKSDEGAMIAWVDGTRRYATKVVIEDGLPDSICTCPYGSDCKHGVATVLEYLERIESKRRVPTIKENDRRLDLLAEEDWEGDWDDEGYEEDESEEEETREQLSAFLQKKTKQQLVGMLMDIIVQHPDVGQDLLDRKRVTGGDSRALVARLRREIQNFGAEPDWDFDDAADFLSLSSKLEMLLTSGHADDVLALGKEMMAATVRHIDDGFEDMDTDWYDCVPILLKALSQSSLEPADRLAWIIDAQLEDDYSLFDDLRPYLNRRHAKATWSALADQLLARLKAMAYTHNDDDFHAKYARDRLSDWIINALEKAGRQGEIIALCEAEARKTKSYVRLVKRLIEAKRYDEAKQWIQEGIDATEGKRAGVVSDLRTALLTIYAQRKDWKTLAALQVDNFVRSPSVRTFSDCQKAANRIKAWGKIRPGLLTFLEKGTLPWKQRGWPLGGTDLKAPEPDQRSRFPMLGHLIDIAILEKKPDRVLYWFDQMPKNTRWGYGISEDRIATAVQTHAPERAVAIWQHMAEALIAQTKPRAYEEAVQYLRKAGQVMTKQKKKTKWSEYLKSLHQTHARKRRFLEILDSLDSTPIVKRKR